MLAESVHNSVFTVIQTVHKGSADIIVFMFYASLRRYINWPITLRYMFKPRGLHFECYHFVPGNLHILQHLDWSMLQFRAFCHQLHIIGSGSHGPTVQSLPGQGHAAKSDKDRSCSTRWEIFQLPAWASRCIRVRPVRADGIYLQIYTPHQVRD